MSVKDAADAEFASVMAELEAEQAGDPGEEAAPEADSVEGDPEVGEDTEGEEEEIEEAEEPAEPVDVESFKDELAQLLDDGDLKGLAEKLGKDPAVFKLNPRQFKAARKAAADAARDRAAADARASLAERTKSEIEAKAQRAEEHYGPIFNGFQAYKQGDPTGVRAAIEAMTGDKFENVVGAIARAAKGLDPGQIEVIKLRRELAERDAAKAKEAEAASVAQVQAQDVTNVQAKLAGTSLDGIEGAAADIVKVLRTSVDPRTGKPLKTLKEAFSEVKAGYAKRAAELAKLTQQRPAPKKEERQPLVPRKTIPAAKKLTPEQEFAKELEQAKKDTAAAERRVRRAR